MKQTMKKSKKALMIFKKVTGIILIIVGIFLTFLTAFWIIGVPLLVWGAVLYDKSKLMEDEINDK